MLGHWAGVHGDVQDPAEKAVGVLQELVLESRDTPVLVLGAASSCKDHSPSQGRGKREGRYHRHIPHPRSLLLSDLIMSAWSSISVRFAKGFVLK